MKSYSIIYIRFGDLPIGGRSTNYLTGEKEIGISVYEGIEREDGEYSIVFPNLTESCCVSLSGCLQRKAYLVEGEVVGRGSDGEPLLTKCRIIREINFCKKEKDK